MEEIREEIQKIRELVEEKKLNELREILNDANSVDISGILEELSEELDKEKILIAFRILNKEKAGEVFSYLSPEMQEKLIVRLTDAEIKNVVDELFMDDMVDLLEEMPSNVVKRILKNVKKEDRVIINELLKYPEDSAGSIMTTEFVDLKENMTVEEALNKIRKIGLEKETIYYCYVLTKNRTLIGTIDLKKLVIREKNEKIKDLMETNVIKVTTLEDKENVAKTFSKYNFLALPVVDKEDKLVGIVTFDDAIDVIQDEATEDLEKMAAIAPSEDSYFTTGTFTHAKNRIVWLLVLMLSATVTGGIITKYENAFAAIPLLVSFIPMIMGTGGNCGAQSSTLIIRGLATDEIEVRDILKVIWKEIRVAIVVGLVLAVLDGLYILIRYQNPMLALTLGLTLMLTVILAKLIGCCLPLLAKVLKLDPALMASPLITTIVDTCSVLIFFKVATLIMLR
jgi:magnesium transporter